MRPASRRMWWTLSWRVIRATVFGLFRATVELAGTDGSKLDAVPRVVDVRGALSIVDAPGVASATRRSRSPSTQQSTRAIQAGIGACSVIRCGHAGRAGAWAERAVANGVVASCSSAGQNRRS